MKKYRRKCAELVKRNTIESFLYSFNSRSPLKRSRRRFLPCICTSCLVLVTLTPFILSILYSFVILQPNDVESPRTDTIISLTSIPARFHYELPYAIHSLLSQTELPKQIRVYLSPTASITSNANLSLTHLKNYVQYLDSSDNIAQLFDRLVQIHLEEEDFGPATKFLPIIREFASQSQAIMICDDDQYYHPYTLATLNQYSRQYPNSIIGFRGWRVRKDLVWGVGGKYEMAHHIIEAARLVEPYRVGVLTANDAYLIRPSFFDSRIYRDFDKAPDDVRHVDDIWLNGQASKRNVARFVIPSCCSHTIVTRTHVLEEYFGRHRMNRLTANNHALTWFANSWEPDLWYQFYGVNGPEYRGWLKLLSREWLNFLLTLKFTFYFGWV